MRLTLSILLLALPVLADTTIINVTNSITAYNEPSSSHSLPAGDDIRINAQVGDGATNVNFDAGGGHSFRVDVYSTIDQPKALVFTGANETTASGSLSDGQVRFAIDPLPAGSYEVYAVAIPANDPSEEYPVAWHLLDVTNAVVAAANVSATFTNEVNISNVTVQWEVQGDGDLAPDSTDRTVSPHTDLGASLGRTNERYGEAHVKDGYFETIRAGTVNVESAIGFLDNTKVKLVGETNSVDLTGAFVTVSDPTNDTQVANRGYVNLVAGGAANMGTVQLSTNPYGEVVFTNSVGDAIVIAEKLAGESPDIVHHYNSASEITTNLNIGAITYVVTNGNLIASLPNEAGSLRIIDYNLITTGQWVRAAVKVNQGAIRAIRSTVQQTVWGIAWQRTDGTNFIWGFDHSSSTVPLARMIEFTALYARVYPYVSGRAPYDTFNTATPADTLMISADGTFYAVDFDGTNTIRGYFGHGKDSLQLVHVATNVIQTGVQIAGFGAGLFSYQPTAGATSTLFVVGSLETEQGKLWRSPWQY